MTRHEASDRTEEQNQALMRNKGRIVSDDEGQKSHNNTPRPDAGNCCVTAHMNTSKSALGLVRSGKVHYSHNHRHKISAARPHGNSNCLFDCMESGVSDNLSHVKSTDDDMKQRKTSNRHI